MDYKLIDFKVFGDERGNLVSLEGLKGVPFDIKRVYYIFGVPAGEVRGKHAHKDLEQVMVVMNGACDVLLDDGEKRVTVRLDTPSRGLYIEHNIWREMMNFAPDTVIAVLASKHYDEADYIRNYDDFLKVVGK